MEAATTGCSIVGAFAAAIRSLALQDSTGVLYVQAAVELLEQKALHNLHLEALKVGQRGLVLILTIPIHVSQACEYWFVQPVSWFVIADARVLCHVRNCLNHSRIGPLSW